MSNHPTQWKSRFGFIMAATGAAVGLGNIWKFPYVAGQNGGSAFFLVFILCLLFIAIPVLKSEVVIGRLGRQNAVLSLEKLSQHYHRTRTWRFLGWLGMLILCMILAFYSVVAGWSIAYIDFAIRGLFVNSAPHSIEDLWLNMLQTPKHLCLWHAIFMILTLGVVAKGVEKGIEISSKIMMPLLFVVLLILVLFAYTTGSFQEGLIFLLKPDFSKITLPIILSAMGQAFFSLAVGAGCMLVYGAYLPPKGSINRSLEMIAWLNVVVALLAGLAIFPLVFAYHLTPEEGPGLVYKILPLAFAQMPFGTFLGSLFFILLLFAAWTSSISMAEPLVLLLMEQWKLKRGLAALIIGIITFLFGLGTVFSFNIGANIRIFGFPLFNVLVDLPINILLPLGGLGYVLFGGWILPKAHYEQGLGGPYSRFQQFLTKIIAPIGIIIILISNLELL